MKQFISLVLVLVSLGWSASSSAGTWVEFAGIGHWIDSETNLRKCEYMNPKNLDMLRYTCVQPSQICPSTMNIWV